MGPQGRRGARVARSIVFFRFGASGMIARRAAEVPLFGVPYGVMVRNMLRTYVGYRPWETWTFGSECDGAFAQYAKAPSREVWKVGGEWNDIELATLPCAYFTAENMLHRAGVTAGDLVLVSSS